MLASALADPNPVLIFEHARLYPVEGELASDSGAVEIERARLRRRGGAVSLVCYGGTLDKTLEAAETLAAQGIEADVLDLRVLRPLDEAAILETVSRTHRLVIVDEGWRSGSLSAEVAARVAERAFYQLDAPIRRVCSAEVPIPYPKHLEDAALPQPDAIVAAVRELLGANG